MELIIGLAITAMVLTALSAVTYAVSNSWENADSADSAYVTGGQVQARIAEYIRPAGAIGAVQRGSLTSSSSPATLFFWMGDQTSSTYPTGDGKIEYNEIGLLRYDAASQQLRLYYASDWATWSVIAQTTANTLAGTVYINTSANFSDFMTACPNYRIIMRDVTGVMFNTVTTNDKPLVEFVVTMTDSNGLSSTHYGTETLRAAESASN